MRYLIGFALAGSVLIGSSANAETAKLSEQNVHDARCALVTAMLADEAADQNANAAVVGIVYFFGKLRGSLPDTPFDAIFTPEFVFEVAERVDSYRQACGQELLSVGPEMQELGKKISALADAEEEAAK